MSHKTTQPTPKRNEISKAVNGTLQGQTVQPAAIVHSESQVSQFAGPIPPPELLQAYEKIVPGSAERILALAEQEQKHRHEIDNKESAQKDQLIANASKENMLMLGLTKRAQTVGLYIIAACLIFAFILALLGIDKWIVCSFLGVTGAAYLVRIFPTIKKSSEK